MRKEVTSIFGRSQRDASSATVAPSASTTHSCASTSQSSSLLAEADRLISSLRKGTTSAVGRRLKHSKRKTDAHVDPPKRKTTELQRQIIVIQYQGASSEAEETTSLHDKDIVVDGFIRFPSSADEEDIRFEIAEMIRTKKNTKMDFTTISTSDFVFVMVANKKIRVPDGAVPFDAIGLSKAYRGSVYVRLTKDCKVCRHKSEFKDRVVHRVVWCMQ